MKRACMRQPWTFICMCGTFWWLLDPVVRTRGGIWYCVLVVYNENPTRALNTTSLKCCLPSIDAIDRREKIHTWIWRLKVTSCKRATLKSSRFLQTNKVGYFFNRVLCALSSLSLHRGVFFKRRSILVRRLTLISIFHNQAWDHVECTEVWTTQQYIGSFCPAMTSLSRYLRRLLLVFRSLQACLFFCACFRGVLWTN